MIFERRCSSSISLAAILTGLVYTALVCVLASFGAFSVRSKPQIVLSQQIISLNLTAGRTAAASSEKAVPQPNNKQFSAQQKTVETQNRVASVVATAQQRHLQKNETDIHATANTDALTTRAADGNATPQTLQIASENTDAQIDIKNAFLRELDEKIKQKLAYPERARKRNAEGTVTARIGITADGRLQYARLEKSSGSGLLDEAALALLNRILPLSVKPPYAFETSIRITYRLQ